MHCKYLPLSPYKALEKFSKALYGTKGGTYSARIFRPVMEVNGKENTVGKIARRWQIKKSTHAQIVILAKFYTIT